VRFARVDAACALPSSNGAVALRASGCRRAEGSAQPVGADGLVPEIDALSLRQGEDHQAGQQAEDDAVPEVLVMSRLAK